MKKKSRNQELKESSNKLSYTAGTITGLNSRNILSKLSKRKPLGAANFATLGLTAGLNIASTIQNARGSTGIGDFIGSEFGNMFRAMGASFLASSASGIAGKGLSKLRPYAKKAGKAARTRRSPGGMKDVNKKGVRFVRIRGRVIPIRVKK